MLIEAFNTNGKQYKLQNLNDEMWDYEDQSQ